MPPTHFGCILGTMAADPVYRPIPVVPSKTSRIDPTERDWVTGTRYGDLKASTLTGVIQRAERGDVADLADLYEYAIRTTDCLTSLYETRLLRVTQAEYEIVEPPDPWNPLLARMAAEFINDQVRRIDGFKKSLKELLHAIAIGYSASECEYARDTARRINYVKRIHFVHAHRFRYDEQWNLRLYDRGRRTSAGSAYGEMLDPRSWIVHEHRAVAGYPGNSGVMAACIWRWMFARWVDRFWILHQEKYGSPIAYAKVNPNTPNAVRTQILSDLQNLSNEHTGVFEGHEIVLLEAATTNPEGYKAYIDFTNAQHAKTWLGASDLTDPGTHGSQSAVSTRTNLTADPRMTSDAESLSETLRRSLFRGLIEFNLHKFPPGTELADIPMPIMRMATGVNREEAQGKGAAVPEVGKGMEIGAGDGTSGTGVAAMSVQTVDALRGIVADVVTGKMPRESAIALVWLLMPDAEADVVDSLVPGGVPVPAPSAEPVEPPPPKASAPVAPGQTSQATKQGSTRRISSRSRSPFATSLRRG